jgi:hypothetical protein
MTTRPETELILRVWGYYDGRTGKRKSPVGVNLGEERKWAAATGGLRLPRLAQDPWKSLDPLSSLSRHREDATTTVRTAWFLSEVECFHSHASGFWQQMRNDSIQMGPAKPVATAKNY